MDLTYGVASGLVPVPCAQKTTRLKTVAPGPAWFLPKQKPLYKVETLHRFLKACNVPVTLQGSNLMGKRKYLH